MNPSLERLVRTLLWSETDNSDESGGEPLDANYDITDVDEKSLAELNKRFQSFVEEAEKALTEKFGDEWGSIDDFYTGSASGGFYTEHDFIMTVNGHGCGFWEKGDWQDDVSDILTRLAKKQGEIDAYVGDNGRVHFGFWHESQSQDPSGLS